MWEMAGRLILLATVKNCFLINLYFGCSPLLLDISEASRLISENSPLHQAASKEFMSRSIIIEPEEGSVKY